MLKLWSLQTNIGKAKYVVSYYDGISRNPDGSEFWGIKIFKNKKSLNAFIVKLYDEGYIEQ